MIRLAASRLHTATRDRLYTFNCQGAEPTLYWSDDYGQTFPAQNKVTTRYGDFPCQLAAPGQNGNVFPGSPSIGVHRAGPPGHYRVLTMYPTVDSSTGLQMLAVVNVDFIGNNPPVVFPNHLFDETAIGTSGSSVLFAAMAPTDHFEFDDRTSAWDGSVALWWLSTDIALGQVSAKARVTTCVGNFVGSSPEVTLSLSGGFGYTWTWNNLNAPTTGYFVGDYHRGAFFYGTLPGSVGLHPRFLLPWIESNNAMMAPNPNSVIHANILTLSEPP